MHSFAAFMFSVTPFHKDLLISFQSFGTTLKVFASRKPVRKQREVPKNSTPRTNKIAFDEYGSLEDRSSANADLISVNNVDSSNEKLDVQSSTQTSSRNAVLQACIITSGLLFASGMAIRQVGFVPCSPLLGINAKLCVY